MGVHHAQPTHEDREEAEDPPQGAVELQNLVLTGGITRASHGEIGPARFNSRLHRIALTRITHLDLEVADLTEPIEGPLCISKMDDRTTILKTRPSLVDSHDPVGDLVEVELITNPLLEALSTLASQDQFTPCSNRSSCNDPVVG